MICKDVKNKKVIISFVKGHRKIEMSNDEWEEIRQTILNPQACTEIKKPPKMC